MVRFYHICLALIFLGFTWMPAKGQVTIKYSSDCVQFNETVVVDVRADGFTNVRNFNFLTHWDDALLEYVSVDNVHPSLPASEVSFGTPDLTGKPDRITAALIQILNPVEYSLSSSDIMFSITLRVKSSASATSVIDTLDILPKNEFVVFNGGVETKVKPGSRPGMIEVNVNCDATNTLSMGTVSGLPGTEVCVPINAISMSNLGAFQGLLLNWDPSVLTYNRIINKTNPFGDPLVNPAMASSGTVNMQYNYVGPGGIGLTTDSTALFCVCFTVAGDCDASTQLTLTEGATFGIFDANGGVLSYGLGDGEIEVNCCDATAEINEVTCPGGADGSITLTPAGCTNVTSYVWSNTTQTGPSISNLQGGTYNVTITYDGGTNTQELSFDVPSPASFAVASIAFTKVTSGGDGGIDIEITGGTPNYSYLWSNSAVTQDLVNVNVGDYSLTVTDSRNCTATFGPFTVAAAPAISGEEVDVTCANTLTGGVNLSVTGGASPYTFAWSCLGTVDPITGSISGLSGGNCTVTVTDANNCASMATFAIEAPGSAITVNPTITNDVTNNGSGSISLDVNGGWGGYQYAWSDGTNTAYPNANPLTGLFGGNYTVTITDAGNCSRVFGPFSVVGLRVFSTEITPVQCFGDNNGAINIGVIGGSGTYTYDWSCTGGTVDANGNISGLTSGECTVIVTDVVQNSNSTTTFAVPGPNESLVVNIALTTCATGADGVLTANVSGGVAPFTYAWQTTPTQANQSASNLSEGQYSVLVTDSVGCAVMGMGSVNLCNELDCYTAMDVITPNEDGSNDFFIIDCVGNTRTTLRIYTRWGQEVITYDNYQNNWDGRDAGGNLVDEDTYLWVLEVNQANGSTDLFKGAVSVLYSLR